MQNPLIIGKIGKPHGVLGFVSVISFTQNPEDILTYTAWQIGEANTWQQIAIESTRPTAEKILVKFKGYDSPEIVSRLTNQFIAIERTQLPKLNNDEIYWADLIGLTVINEEGENLGIIESLFETGGHDVMVIQGEKSYLIPFSRKHFISAISLEQKLMHVRWSAEDTC